MAPKDVLDIRIAVIGAGRQEHLQADTMHEICHHLGMGGLATAISLAEKGFQNIDVYEAASNLGFVGAGIQLAPNMVRILDRLGVWKDIEAKAVDLKETRILRTYRCEYVATAVGLLKYNTGGATNDQLAHVDLNYIREKYIYPHMVGHRSNLANSMFQGCKKHKSINFFFATTVSKVNVYGPRPTFSAVPRQGETYTVESDVLLASDGVKSVVRDQLLRHTGVDAKIVDTGQAAYRIMLR